METKLKIGFTIGDVNGIGPEVLIKALSDNRILKICTPIIYGSNRVISFYKKLINAEGFNYSICSSAMNPSPKSVNIINSITEEVDIQPGIVTDAGGKYALISLEAATEDLITNKIDALVTAPINKNTMQQVGFNYAGHTEYFNAKAGNMESVMLLMNDNLRVGLATNHVAIKDISTALTKEKISQKLDILHQSLIRDFAIYRPIIAVLGLNPHSGDNGLLGSEEQTIIVPALKEVQDKKIIALGPFSADGFFGAGHWLKFDAVLAMYHDQGLAPFKALSFGSGINYTAGLPFVRTSPDHGTAYDIAGKGEASGDSMQQAIFTAIDIIRNRTDYAESIKNPLKRNFVESERG